ncbi:MAG: glycosyltransferase [Bacteroidia bacterium]
MQDLKSLLFFTESYPTGWSDLFIEPEAEYLRNKFNKIYVFPLNKREGKLACPETFNVIHFNHYTAHNRIKTFFNYFRPICYILFYELLFSPHRFKYIKKLPHYFNFLLARVHDAFLLEMQLKKIVNLKSDNVVFYSYWFNLWMMDLSILKLKYPNLNLISRVHGGDYDESRRKEGFYLYRHFQIKQVDKVVSISNYGVNYLKKQFPKFQSKFSCSYLGVFNHGINPAKANEDIYTIVSCSTLIPLKRVHLLIYALSKISIPVKWYHFGTGPLEVELKQKANLLPQNVKYEFKGHMSNEAILEFYKNNHISLFVNTSSVEGIPVSIMEAISFGIPIAAPAICGIPEIVNEKTGYLLNSDFTTAELCDVITNYYGLSENDKIKLRQSSRNFWKECFNASLNFESFVSNLE